MPWLSCALASDAGFTVIDSQKYLESKIINVVKLRAAIRPHFPDVATAEAEVGPQRCSRGPVR